METRRENNVCRWMCACRTKGTRAALLPDDQKEGQKKEPALKKKKKRIIYKYIMVQEKVEHRWATERNQRDERDEEDGVEKRQ